MPDSHLERSDLLVTFERLPLQSVAYRDADGKQRQSKLLLSGFWGWARHMNYTFEIIICLTWCLPGYHYGPLPFILMLMIVPLLVHRTFRQSEKCAAKYGDGWQRYCQAVPYRMIPFVF